MVNTNQTMQRNYRSSYSFDHLRSWRQQSGNGVPERFPVWRTGFLDGFQLFEVGLIDSDRFQDGGIKPKAVFRDGSKCGGRGFSTEYCWRVAQLTLAVGHTRRQSKTNIPVSCRLGGIHLESTIAVYMRNSCNSSINNITHTGKLGTATKRHLRLGLVATTF